MVLSLRKDTTADDHLQLAARVVVFLAEETMDRFRIILLTVLGCALGASLINAPYLEHQLLQHVMTVVGLWILLYFDGKHRLSHSAYAMMIVFGLIHILGARYVYSYVPYDEWTKSLFGFSLTETFHLTRNHYDRLVHLLWGLLLVKPAMEWYRGLLHVTPRTAILLAMLTLQTGSMCYEIGEWWVTLVFAREDAEAYNGQQGDMWDPQKDMGLGFVGSVVAGVYFVMREKKKP